MIRSVSRRALMSAGIFGGVVMTVGARAELTEPTGPQAKLTTRALTITTTDGGKHEFSVELARTPREQQVGLMYRTSIAPDEGMLFIWPRPQVNQMWMQHCPVPEDMVFIGTDGTIVSIAENTVPESLAPIGPSNLVTAATLELQGGITARLGINVGDRVECKALAVA